MPPIHHTLHERFTIVLKWTLFLLIGAMFCVRNLPWHLDDFDQAKQAFTSLEMVKDGHWWYQHTPSGMSATKPPFAGWLAAGFYFLLGGWWEGAWRAPSLLGAVAVLLMLWWAGNKLLPSWGGMVAVAAFAFNMMAPRLATLVRTDMMMTAWTCGMGLLIWQKIRTGTAWTTRERSLLCALALGSVFTKGPIAYAMILPGVLWMMWSSRHDARAGSAWAGWSPWLAPLLALAVWATVGSLTDPQFYEQVIKKEFLGRVTGEHRSQPVYYYVPHLLQKFAPWSLLLIALGCVREIRQVFRKDAGLMWLLAWALGGLLLFSIIPSKRTDRIFPIIPPLCLMIPGMLAALPNSRLFRWDAPRLVAGCTILAALTSGGYAVYRATTNFHNHEDALVQFGKNAIQMSKAKGWKLGVSQGLDEGLALYTEHTQLTEKDDTVELWRSGVVDALILSQSKASQLQDAGVPYRVISKSEKTTASRDTHLFIAREGACTERSPGD